MKWISIKDRLPPLGNNEKGEPIFASEEVLIIEENGAMFVACLRAKGTWKENSTGCGCCEIGVYPTHWMPLPEPPTTDSVDIGNKPVEEPQKTQ